MELWSGSEVDIECLPPLIKIIGVGGSGCMVVDRLVEEGFNADDCVMAGSTLLECWGESRCSIKIALAESVPTKGLDGANDPVWCCEATIASSDIIQGHLDGSVLNFIVASMGGGIGTFAGPIIAGISKAMGAVTIAVISKPFLFEGEHRLRKALTGIEEMKNAADMTVLIPYDCLQEMLSPGAKIIDAFDTASETLKRCVKDLHGLVTRQTGAIDGDFESKKPFLQNAGLSYIGFGSGNNVKEAMGKAISCPMLGDVDLHRAGTIFVNINAVSNTILADIHEALDLLTGTLHNDETAIIFNVTFGDEVGVLLIAASSS
jgi:cell division protein FtsZ